MFGSKGVLALKGPLEIGTEKKSHDSQRRDRILLFFSPPGYRTIFFTFWGGFLSNYTIKPEEKEKNPLRKIQ